MGPHSRICARMCVDAEFMPLWALFVYLPIHPLTWDTDLLIWLTPVNLLQLSPAPNHTGGPPNILYKYTGRRPRTCEQKRHTEVSVCCLWRALFWGIWHKCGACHRKHVNGKSGLRNNRPSVFGCHESSCEFARLLGSTFWHVQVQKPA